MTIHFNSFAQLIDGLKHRGYTVERLESGGAIVFNDGVHDNYSEFDNRVATIVMQSGFNFLPPNNMKLLHEKTVLEDRPADEFKMYIGIYEDDCSTLRDTTKYTFLEENP